MLHVDRAALLTDIALAAASNGEIQRDLTQDPSPRTWEEAMPRPLARSGFLYP